MLNSNAHKTLILRPSKLFLSLNVEKLVGNLIISSIEIQINI